MRQLDWVLVGVTWLSLMVACWALYLGLKSNDRVTELSDPEIGRIAELEYRMNCQESARAKTEERLSQIVPESVDTRSGL